VDAPHRRLLRGLRRGRLDRVVGRGLAAALLAEALGRGRQPLRVGDGARCAEERVELGEDAGRVAAAEAVLRIGLGDAEEDSARAGGDVL
jgi:hypothetical protein